MGLAESLHAMGDRADGWKRDGESWTYLRKVKFRSMEDVQSIVDALAAEGGVVRTFLGYRIVSLDELKGRADSELNEVWVEAFESDPGPNPMHGGYAWVRIANAAARADSRGLPYLSVYVGPAPAGTIRHLTTEQLAKKVLGAVEHTRSWNRKANYPVIDTITKATLHQRKHDRKVRWQAAAISFVAAIATTALVNLLFPATSGG